MPKKSTGYTPTGRQKSSSISKETTPLKTPSLKGVDVPNKMSGTKAKSNLPNALNGGPSNTASLPGVRFPKLTKPDKINPRTPRI